MCGNRFFEKHFHIRRRAQILACCGMFFCALLLAGCGGERETENGKRGDGAQWRESGFAAPGELLVGEKLYAGQFQLWEREETEYGRDGEEPIYLDFGVCGQFLWRFGEQRGEDGGLARGPEGLYFLEIWDTETGGMRTERFMSGDLGLEGEESFLCDMEMLDEEHFVFRFLDYERTESGYSQISDGMLWTDLDQNTSRQDFLEEYLALGIEGTREATELPLIQQLEWSLDGKGDIQILYSEGGGMDSACVFGKEGEILLQWSGSPQQHALGFLRGDGGESILAVCDFTEETCEFLLSCGEQGTFSSLGKLQTEGTNLKLYGMLGDELYYSAEEEGLGEGLISWNVATGERRFLYGFQDAGMGVNARFLFALRDGLPPVVCLLDHEETGNDRIWTAELSRERPETPDPLQVADFTGSCEYVRECLPELSRSNPSYTYEYADASSEEVRERILAELSRGEGPAFFVMNAGDFYMLREKGVFLDLAELLPDRQKDELLPGAWVYGGTDGSLQGVTLRVWAQTLLVPGGIACGEEWTLEQVIQLMEEGSLSGAVRYAPFEMQGRYLPFEDAVLSLLDAYLWDSALIDREKGISHFDDGRFVKLLELMRAGTEASLAGGEEWFGNGDIVMADVWFPADFMELFGRLENGEGQIAGFPGESGGESSLSGMILAVNAGLEDKQAAAFLLEMLLGEKMQSKTTAMEMSARRMNPETLAVPGEDGRLFYMGGDEEVPVFADGTNAFDRAAAFLESCTAQPRRDLQIMNILREELSAMATGNIPAAKAAETIDRRVQLYLDEKNT